jgi:hypothetical protein
MKCRRCGQFVTEETVSCPNCGVLHPAKTEPEGRGFEYKSEATLFGLPILHISFKYRPSRSRWNTRPLPVPAKGIIAVGQFAFGFVTISQFGVGLFSLSQFTIAGFAVAQFALGYSLIAQFGVFLHQGRGQFVMSLTEIFRLFS